MASSSLRHFLLLASALVVFNACSGDDAPGGGGGSSDGGGGGGSSSTNDNGGSSERDSGTTEKDSGAGGDGGLCGPIVTTPGETCVGFGAKSDTCDPSCGQPYGYVCFDGAPPSFEGCRKVSDTSVGQTYCCPKNDCVAQPDQDKMCNGTAGKPHRFQCPPDGKGGNVTPPAGCEEKGSGGTELEKFYCCP